MIHEHCGGGWTMFLQMSPCFICISDICTSTHSWSRFCTTPQVDSSNTPTSLIVTNRSHTETARVFKDSQNKKVGNHSSRPLWHKNDPPNLIPVCPYLASSPPAAAPPPFSSVGGVSALSCLILLTASSSSSGLRAGWSGLASCSWGALCCCWTSGVSKPPSSSAEVVCNKICLKGWSVSREGFS